MLGKKQKPTMDIFSNVEEVRSEELRAARARSNLDVLEGTKTKRRKTVHGRVAVDSAMEEVIDS